jgi:hypothetical protein
MMIGYRDTTWNMLFEERREFLKDEKHVIHLKKKKSSCTCFAKFDIIILQSLTFENVKAW